MPREAGTGPPAVARVGEPAGPGLGSGPFAAVLLAGPGAGGVRAGRPGGFPPHLPPEAHGPRRTVCPVPADACRPAAERPGAEEEFTRATRPARGSVTERGRRRPPAGGAGRDRDRVARTPAPTTALAGALAVMGAADLPPAAPDHPHLADRGRVATHGGGAARPAPAPRFTAHPDALRLPPGWSTADSAAVAERREWPGGPGEPT